MKYLMPLFFILISFINGIADNGYKLWLDYKPLDKHTALHKYGFINDCYADNAINDEIGNNAKFLLSKHLSTMLSKKIAFHSTNKQSQIILTLNKTNTTINDEGYQIKFRNKKLTIEAKTSKGLLYGVMRLLAMVHQCTDLTKANITDSPKIQNRILNHWDNIDRTIERGYSGFSIWNWHELPDAIDPRYEDYALANASIGINGTVLTNVNANAIVLREDYIQKTAALANVFRKYGIKVYLTARFSAPIELGKLKTADPLDPQVMQWWKNKIEEIYRVIPDFGGFLVKANSEGQPGPQDYGRSHADGANMLASALMPYNGIVMWRAFVYSHASNEDRFKQAYREFAPLDGKFLSNVLLQVKNGPIDFQPREPVHPLFGAMPKTPLMLEFQITKEYLGQGTHLVGLANMYAEVLATDTYVKGQGSTIAKIIDGTLHGYKATGIAGVANIGTAFNWTGNFFGQADWYAFGKMAWNPYIHADTVFKEWVNATFASCNTKVKSTAIQLLDESHEACVNYMTPLGLHHIMAEGHHYGPGPWVDSLQRADWTAVYYHKADALGIGFDRTESGSNALELYNPEFRAKYKDANTCPDAFLLWFHHIPWQHTMRSGRDLWSEMIAKYDDGVNAVKAMLDKWGSLKGDVDEEIYSSVHDHLSIQYKESQWWRNACLSYFHYRSTLPYPDGIAHPPHDYKYYKNITHPYAPGLKPKW